MPNPAPRSFAIRIVTDERTATLLEFYKPAFSSGYLLPRSLEQLRRMAIGEELFEIVETANGRESLVGACYITHGRDSHDNADSRSEFGGLYVDDACRYLGLGAALGRIAIANLYVWGPPKYGLIAHVHEANSKPINVLKSDLGFEKNGEESFSAKELPGLKANAEGRVVGHLYQFRQSKLLDIANWIEQFRGRHSGKRGLESILGIDVPFMSKSKITVAVAGLRSKSGQT